MVIYDGGDDASGTSLAIPPNFRGMCHIPGEESGGRISEGISPGRREGVCHTVIYIFFIFLDFLYYGEGGVTEIRARARTRTRGEKREKSRDGRYDHMALPL